MTVDWTLFDTAIGRCGVAWNARGVVGVQLPETTVQATRARMRSRFPQGREAAPTPVARAAIEGIAALLEGRPADLAGVALDLERVPAFHRRVYAAARDIAPGTTRTYGDLAASCGSPGAARAVGQALARNPFALVVPCHRVLAANGRPGGFSANGGVNTKLRLLALEATPAPARGGLFAGGHGFGFDPAVAVAHLRAADPALGRLIDAVGPFGMRVKVTPSVFAALAEAIVYQQLSGKAAATIHGRLCDLFPRAPAGPTPERILRARDDSLRAAGLSRPKILALRDLARRCAEGHVPTLAQLHAMENEAIVERLTAVRGIGRWTVEMLLMFRLGRPDVLPLDDLGIRKGYAAAFGKREPPARDALERRGRRWQPWRTVASWYLWRAAERGS